MSDWIALARAAGEAADAARAWMVPVDPATSWGEPRSLDAEHGAAMPYPVDCLPPRISAAVKAYQQYGQQPMALIASAALAALSLAGQALADVGRDKNLIGPCSLSFLTIAESGERKTACDKHFTRAIKNWEAAKRAEIAQKTAVVATRLKLWETKSAYQNRSVAGRNPRIAGRDERF